MKNFAAFSGCAAAAMMLIGPSIGLGGGGHPPHHYRQYAPPYRYCPPGYAPLAPSPALRGEPTPAPRPQMGPDGLPMESSPSDMLPDSMQPSETTADQQPLRQSPPASTAPSSVASAPGSAAPQMIGDSMRPCGSIVAGSGFASVGLPYCPGGGRLFKIGENQSPLPQDRVYFNYNYFDDGQAAFKEQGFFAAGMGIPVTNTSRSFNVHRYTLGAESTVLGGLGSLQIQVPFSNALSSSTTGFIADPDSVLPGETDTELGNIALAFKGILYRSCSMLVSGGVGVDLPTAEDLLVNRVVVPGFSQDTIAIENEAVRLSPYLAALLTPNPRWFALGFVQASLPVNDNSYDYVSVNHFAVPPFNVPPTTVTQSGELNEQSLLYLDLSLGYWLYRNSCCGALINGVAPMVELHYTTTLEDGDVVFLDDPTLGPVFGPGTLGRLESGADIDFLNLTIGTMVTAGRSNIKLAYVTPLLDDENEPFDYEFSVQVNRFF